MTRFLTCVPGVLAVFSLGLASGQSPLPRNLVDFHPLSEGGGPVSDVIVGDFTDDWEPDAVLLDGGVVTLAFTPYLFDAAGTVEPSLTNCAAVGRLRGEAPAGGDTLIATDARGLLKIPYDVDDGFEPPTILAGGGWSNAAPLRTAVDAGGVRHIFGLQPSKLSILSLTNASGSDLPGPTVTTFFPAVDFVPVDWDGDGDLDLAVVTQGGLEVYELDGTHIRTLVDTDDAFVTRVTTGSGVDWVAWARRALPFDYYELLLVNESNWEQPSVQIDLRVPEDPGKPGPTLDLEMTSLSAADLDGGGMDVVLGQRTNQSAYVLIDTLPGSGISYSVSNMLRFDQTENPFQPAGPDVAPPAVGNLDNVANADLVVVSNEEREMRVYTDIVSPVPPGPGGAGTKIKFRGPISPKSPTGTPPSGSTPTPTSLPTSPPNTAPPVAAPTTTTLAGTKDRNRVGRDTRRSRGRGTTSDGAPLPQAQARGAGESGIQSATHDTLGLNPEDFFLGIGFPQLGGSTHVQVVTWRWTEGVEQDVLGFSNDLFPLAVCSGSIYHALHLAVPPAIGTSPRPFYFFQFRLVRVEMSKIVAVSDTRLGVVVPEVVDGEFETGPVEYPYLEQLVAANGPLSLGAGTIVCESSALGTRILGVVYKDTLPPIPPTGSFPHPGPVKFAVPTINY